MLRNEILKLMETLKLRGMHAVFDEVITDGRKRRSAVEKILLNRLKISSSDRGGLNPKKVRRDLCYAILDSLEKMGSSDAAPMLKSIADFFEDSMITAQIEEIIRELKI